MSAKAASDKKTLEEIKREMNEPRATASVRKQNKEFLRYAVRNLNRSA